MGNSVSKFYNSVFNRSSTGSIPMMVGYSDIVKNGGTGGWEQDQDTIFNTDNTVLLDYLKNWHYLDTLANIYQEPISEILESPMPRIQLPKAYYHEEYINRVIQELDPLKELNKKENLKNYIVKGGKFQYLIKNGEDYEFMDINDECRIYSVEERGKRVAYSITDKDGNTESISREKGAFCAYRSKIYKSTTLQEFLDSTKDKDKRDKLVELLKNIDINNKVIRNSIKLITYSTWTSDFESQAHLLYKIWLYELFTELLNIKDTLKQDILVPELPDTGKKVVNMQTIHQSIEHVLNASSGLAYSQNPTEMLYKVLYSFSNSLRVLPNIANFSRIQKMDLGDSTGKIANIKAEIDAFKSQIMGSLGIPEETLISGTSTRWDILSRSDRYMTAITNYLQGINAYIKSIVISIMNYKGVDINPNDINFDIMNNTAVQSQVNRLKVDKFAMDLESTNTIINTSLQIISNPLFDPKAVIEELTTRAKKEGMPYANSMLDPDTIIAKLSGESE